MRSRGSAIESVRQALLGDERARLARLEERLERLQRERKQSDIAAESLLQSMREAARTHPEEMAAVLDLARSTDRPVEEERPARSRSPLRWLASFGAASVVLLAATSSGVHEGGLVPATAEVEMADAAHAPAPKAVVVEEQTQGFGLGDATLPDDVLRAEVRKRLVRVPELAGSHVSLSVTDGWVWLRGETAPDGPGAAAAALENIGDGVLVVNQLVASPRADMLAGR